jgi:hypothetical protein
MAPIAAFAARLRTAGVPGVSERALGFPSWKTFFDTFATGENAAHVGIPLAVASRLVPRANFASAARRAELLDALMGAYAVAPAMRLLLAPPSSYPGDGSTAMHPGWRDAIFHVTLVRTWNFDASADEVAGAYRLADDAIAHVRHITPAVAYVVRCRPWCGAWCRGTYGDAERGVDLRAGPRGDILGPALPAPSRDQAQVVRTLFDEV